MFRLRWAVSDSIPESGLPKLPNQPVSSQMDNAAFLDARGKPWPFGEPVIVNLSIAQNEFGEWKLNWSNPGRSTSHIIDAPPDWLNRRGRGVSARITGSGKTEHGSADEPFVLLRYRKTTTTATGALTVDMNPTDGIIVWLEVND